MRKIIYILLLTLIFFALCKISYSKNDQIAIFQIINKITGNSFLTSISSNSTKHIDGLLINVSSCLINEYDDSNHASFIKIINKKDDKNLFYGWIFSDNQSISEFAHNIYAIRLVKCNN